MTTYLAWAVLICSADLTECRYSFQPSYAACTVQAEMINAATDAVASCTVLKAMDGTSLAVPSDWIIDPKEPKP